MTQETAPLTSSTVISGDLRPIRPKPSHDSSAIAWLPIAGWLFSAVWIALSLSYTVNAVGPENLVDLPPGQLGEFLTGIIAVPALLWMVLGHWQRLNAFRKATESIQTQLAILTTPEARLDKRFDTVLGALQRQANLFTEVSQTAISSLRSARGVLRQEADLLQKTSAESAAGLLKEAAGVREAARGAGLHFTQIDESLGRSSTRYLELQEQLAGGTTTIKTVIGSALQQFDDFTSGLNEQIKLLGMAAKVVRSGQAEAEAAFSSVRQGTETAGRDIASLGDRALGLGTHLDGLRTAVTAGVNDVMAQTERLQKRSETISATLNEQGQRIESVLGQAADVATILSTSGSLARETTDRMRESVISLNGSVVKAVDDIREREENLTIAAKGSLAALREAMAGIDDIIQRSGSAIGGLDRKAGEISFAVATSLNRITDLTGGLAQASETLTRSGIEASTEIATATSGLADQASKIRAVTDGLKHIADTANTTIEQVAKAGNDVETVLAQLESTAQRSEQEISAVAETLADRSSSINEDIGSLEKSIQAQNRVLETHLDTLEKVDGGIRHLAAETDNLLGRVGIVTEKSQILFETIGREIEMNTTVVSDLLGKNAGRVQQLQRDIAHSATEVDASTERLVNRAGEIERAVAGSLSKLDELQQELASVKDGLDRTSAASAERIGNVTSVMREQFSDMRENANRALERLEKVVASITAGSNAVSSAGETAETGLKEALVLLQKNGHAFNEAIDAAMTGMQRAERVLTDEQENLGRTAEAAAIRFSRLGQELAHNSLDLTNTVVASVERLTGMSTTVDQNITSITGNLSQAEATVGSYLATIETLAERSDGVGETLKAQNQLLESNIVLLGSTIGSVQEKAREAARTVTVETAELASMADKTRNNIGAIIDKLRDESRVLTETEADSRALAGRATALLGEKALELASAARQAATEAAVLREADAKVRRDIFLNAAKAVLDGLQSLSVDLTRVLDKDVPEKAWKGLTRGEMPGFTKRLVSLRDHVPEGEIKNKFLVDSVFRSQVQAYMHQFESLLEQAMANDQGDILSSTLMSSDVGKIYYFLSSAVGRDRGSLQRAG
jgi:chromosome segregation ATPase